MRKFHIGEKVYVKNELIPPATPEMIQECGGKIYTIKDYFHTYYILDETKYKYYWGEDSFEKLPVYDFDGLEDLL